MQQGLTAVDGIYHTRWFRRATYGVAAYIVVFIAVWPAAAGRLRFAPAWLVLFTAHGLVMSIALVLTVLHVAHAAKNRRLDGGAKAAWIVMLVCCGALAMPVYYRRHIARA